MKEIKIVLNNDQETFLDNEFSIFIDGEELKNVDSFCLNAKRAVADEKHHIDTNKIVTYTVNYYAPYFEDN